MFQSLLFDRTDERKIEGTLEAPAFFTNLYLDQIIDSITASKMEYNLKPLFYSSLHNVDSIKYRQEIARDLEDGILLENVKSFGIKMAAVRRYLARLENLEYKLHRDGWFLKVIETYCDAVNCLIRDLNLADLKSRGLLAFRQYLAEYSKSSNYQSLLEDTKMSKEDLSSVKYCILIEGSRVRVRKYQSEIDYSQQIARIFDKFKQSEAKDYRNDRFIKSGMNPLDAEILYYVAKLYPEIFSNLDRYHKQYINFMDEALKVFDREVQFYVSYLDCINKIKEANLKFCYPEFTNDDKEIFCYEGFDLTLANKCLAEKFEVVCNDFYLRGKERILIISGPDQGGRATFARSIGQLHYLASLGLPVPGRKARILMWDRLFILNEKEENIQDLRSKLEDDLVRIHSVLVQTTSRTIIIINKILTSTTLQDSIILNQKIVEKIAQLEALCIWVTPVGELGSFCEQTVSMVSTVDPQNPAVRTYKILRKTAGGLSHALSIAEKYNVTYERLKERLKL
jgi:DNA mismatch repair protein MutS